MSNERAVLESQQAHHESSNGSNQKENDPLISKVSTAHVDPEFALNYKPETIDFPESPRDYINESATAIESPTEGYPYNSKSKGKNNSTPSRTNDFREMADQSGPNTLSDNDNSKSSPITTPSSAIAQQQSGQQPQQSQTPQSQPQLDSMNVYGSYIDDSYVGDFSGEVNPDIMIEESQQDPVFWENQTKLVEGVLEFSFDSFGPESMLFPRNGELRADGDEQTKSMYGPVTTKDSDNELMSITTNSERTDVSLDQYGIRTSIDSNEDANWRATSNLSSFSRDHFSPQPPLEAFKRNTSLTQSQRRKIRPKIDIQEIFNSSDETNTHEEDNSGLDNLVENETSKEEDENAFDQDKTPTPERKFSTKEDFVYNDYNNHESPASTREEMEGTLQNTGTLGKKKITVNKELLSNDDIIIDFPTSQQEESRVPELTVREELNESRSWRESCPIGDKGEVKKIDLKVIEPYKKVLSHGGYYHHYNSAQLNKNNSVPSPGPAIIIFSACYLPDRSRKDYGYVMDNLFMYVLTTLHELVADDYILIYFHNAGCAGVSSNNMPTFSWLKRCYTMIDKRLRKNLKSLFLVHPTFWLKTFVIMTKPFISSKFSKKLRFVSTLAELNDLVPIESTVIPPPVKQVEFERTIRQKKKESSRR